MGNAAWMGNEQGRCEEIYRAETNVVAAVTDSSVDLVLNLLAMLKVKGRLTHSWGRKLLAR